MDFNDMEFDENGRLIIKGSEEEQNNSDEQTIVFAELNNDTGICETYNVWKIKDYNHGAFFVVPGDESFLGARIEMRNDLELVVWESRIVAIPENTFKDFNGKDYKYMSEKSVNIESLAYKCGGYTVEILGHDILTTVYIEDGRIEETEDLEENIEDTIVEQKIIEEVVEEVQADNAVDTIDELSSLEALLREVTDDSSDVSATESKENIEEATEIETIENTMEDSILDEIIAEVSPEVEEVMPEVDELLPTAEDITNEDIIEETKEMGNKVVEEKNELKEEIVVVEKKEVDKVKQIADKFFDLVPANIKIEKFSDYYSVNFDYNIIIEKVKEKYIVTVKGLAFKNFKLLENEDIYFNFEGGLENFVHKVNKMLKNMYMMDEKSLNDLTIMAIIDEEDDINLEIFDNVSVMMRGKAVSYLNNVSINTMHLTEGNAEVWYVDEKGKRIIASALINDEESKEMMLDLASDLNGYMELIDESGEINRFRCLADQLV